MAQWFQSLQHCLYNCHRHGLRTEKAQGGFKTAVLGKLNAGWKKIMSMLALMKDRRVILSVLLYALAGFVGIITYEVNTCIQLTCH